MRRTITTALAALVMAVMAIPAHAGLPGFWNEKNFRGGKTVVFHYRGTNTSAVHISLQWWRITRRPSVHAPVHVVTADLNPGRRTWSWAHQFSRRNRRYHVDVYGWSVSFWRRLWHALIVGPLPTPLRAADCNTFTTGDGETWACWDGCPPPCVGGTQ